MTNGVWKGHNKENRKMERQNKRIIITQRVWQLIVLICFLILTSFARDYPLGFRLIGIRLFVSIFLIIFSLTYTREERRATKPAPSNLVINWNLAESVLLLLSIIGFFVFAFIQDFNRNLFYAYFNIGFLGLLCGVGIGELLWQNTTLGKLDDYSRRRYWANYKIQYGRFVIYQQLGIAWEFLGLQCKYWDGYKKEFAFY